MLKSTARLVSTFFYIGEFPVAPGTLASVAGVLIYIIVGGNLPLFLATTAVVTVLGFLFSGITEKALNRKDPGCIVIDEVAGIMIAFFMLPLEWPVIITAFFLFRAFDMFKIYPVNKFESLGGSVGVMMDDLFAGLYTNVTMHIALRLAHLF